MYSGVLNAQAHRGRSSAAVSASRSGCDAGSLGSADVDEDALAAAIAADELADVTADELAQMEAGLALGDEPDESDESNAVDDEEPAL